MNGSIVSVTAWTLVRSKIAVVQLISILKVESIASVTPRISGIDLSCTLCNTCSCSCWINSRNSSCLGSKVFDCFFSHVVNDSHAVVCLPLNLETVNHRSLGRFDSCCEGLLDDIVVLLRSRCLRSNLLCT